VTNTTNKKRVAAAPQHPGGKDASRWRAWAWERLGFGSIRGRYLHVAGLFVALVLAAGWAAQDVVSRSARQSSVNVSEREQIGHLLNDLSNDVWLTDTALQGYLLTPDKGQLSAILAALDHLLSDVDVLARTPWSQQTAARRDKLAQLTRQIGELRAQSVRLTEIRADAEKLFPAMRHMVDKMLPNHLRFLTYATLAMDEAGEYRDRPAQQEALRLFTETRYAWALMVGAFRVFVANRFGVFPGDPEEGMRAQHDQIEFHHERVERHLDELAHLAAQGSLEFQQTESLAQLRRISREWYRAYQAAAAIYSSERWRTDVPLLRDIIRPLFTQVWVDLGVLRGELESASITDMASLAGSADRLSSALWLIALLTIALTGAGYLLFEYTVRRPIADVAAGLKAEARGQHSWRAQPTNTAETRDLIEAFDHMRAQVHSRQQRLQSILDNAAEGIITFDAQGVIEGYNLAAQRLFGWSEREMTGQHVSQLVVRDPAAGGESYLARFQDGALDGLVGQEGEVSGRRQGGDRFPMAIKISALQLDGRRLYTALVADISERKAMVEHLRDLAEHDDLTGLHNRSFFLHELDRVVERARRSHQHCTLLYIDLDNFKYVNDTLGHLAGDRLLIEVSQLLRKRTRRGDLLARLGGDEFTMLLYDTRMDEARGIAESFRRALTDYRFRHGGEQVDMGCSIGAAMIAGESRSAQEILSRADFACHLAKRGGRNRVHVFDAGDEANVAALSLDMGWTRRIKDAIEQDHFVLAGQPIVATRTPDATSYEVLIRLRDERGGLIMPSGFLPSAERFGLSADIDRWVIVHAIRMLAAHRAQRPDLRYSVNLSAQTLSQPGVCDLIIDELHRTGLDPAALTFEVTETTAIADMASAEGFLGRLKEIGCRTALDDFGSGMSSFAYLRELPVDCVKIDGRFVKNMAANPMDQAMVRAMNDIAHALGKTTIAEFVETAECFRLLGDYGVDYAQGFHLGRPEVIPAVPEERVASAGRRVIYLHPR
jgi:diguanylate cyclase (GGDEF)-like protein/PAS domain S-box-containing protein